MVGFVDISDLLDTDIDINDYLDKVDNCDIYEEASNRLYRVRNGDLREECAEFARSFIDCDQMVSIAKVLIEELNERISEVENKK